MNFLIQRSELRDLGEKVAAGERLDEADAQLGAAARRWLDLPEVLPAERGGNKRDCQRRYITDLLTWLVAAGRARREPSVSDERGQAYTLNDRFRIGIAETAETLAYRILTRGDEEGQA